MLAAVLAKAASLAKDADQRIVYERVLREAATTEEVSHYANGAVLVQVWLPQRVLGRWEERFPELTRAA